MLVLVLNLRSASHSVARQHWFATLKWPQQKEAYRLRSNSMHTSISRRFTGLALTLLGTFVSASALCAQPATLGIFDGQQDVGTILHPGSAVYDASTGTYTLSGSGDNIWWAEDDFHYMWKKVSGDFSLSAGIALLGSGGEPHRKAVLMIRQSLDQDSAAVALAVHGDGLTSLQWRLTRGDNM